MKTQSNTFTSKQTGLILGISRHGVNELCRRGLLPYVQVLHSRTNRPQNVVSLPDLIAEMSHRAKEKRAGGHVRKLR